MIIEMDIMVKMLMSFEAFLILKKKFIPNSKNNGISVYMAGYILNADKNSPWNKNAMALCAPQPGHSKPKKVLVKQGSMYCSNEAIN